MILDPDFFRAISEAEAKATEDDRDEANSEVSSATNRALPTDESPFAACRCDGWPEPAGRATFRRVASLACPADRPLPEFFLDPFSPLTGGGVRRLAVTR